MDRFVVFICFTQPSLAVDWIPISYLPAIGLHMRAWCVTMPVDWAPPMRLALNKLFVVLLGDVKQFPSVDVRC